MLSDRIILSVHTRNFFFYKLYGLKLEKLRIKLTQSGRSVIVLFKLPTVNGKQAFDWLALRTKDLFGQAPRL